MPVPIDEAPQQRPSNVVNLMDALRKSIGGDRSRQETAEEREGSAGQGHRHREGACQVRQTQIRLISLGYRP